MLLAVGALAAARGAGRQDGLEKLDEALSMKGTYEEYFARRMDALRAVRKDSMGPDARYQINMTIADEFSSYSMDSTIAYLEENLEIAKAMEDRTRSMETEFLMAKEYGRAGYLPDALGIMDKYRDEDVPEDLKYAFRSVQNYIYGELAVYTSQGSEYWEKRNATRAYLLSCTEEGTYEWYDQKRVQAESTDDRSKALEYALAALDAVPLNSKDYARAAFFVSVYQNNEEERLEWLVRSAIADVMCANKDYASLSEISEILFRKGDIERAFKYVADHCMSDALVFNGRLRPWQIAQFFPALENAYAEKSRADKTRLNTLVIVSFVLLVLLAVLLWIMGRRQRVLVRTRKELEQSKSSLEDRNAELGEMNRVRQEYIALFLQNLSDNISTSRQYRNHVLKYLKRGDAKYLLEEMESQPAIEEDIQAFNKMFDRTFINLYPDFVEKFNSLLSEPEVPKGDDILTPELRVFALIKLGISDSSRIASLLHYSANTIYNYRAKIKNKALGDRDRFEAAVIGIE